MILNGKKVSSKELEVYMSGLKKGTNTGRAMSLAEVKANEKYRSNSFTGKFMSLDLRRKKNGCINEASLNAMKYVATKPANGDFEAMYIVRNTLKEECRVYREVNKYDKDLKRLVPNLQDPMKIGLASLKFYTNVETMFDNIKEVDKYETFQYIGDSRDFHDDAEAEELAEYMFDDTFGVCEVLAFITYKASFCGRDIAYRRRTDTMEIVSVESWLSYEASWKSRNLFMSSHQSVERLFDNYEKSLNIQTGQEWGMLSDGKAEEGSGVYGSGYCVAH